MDLGGVRQKKMTRTNCERLNDVKMVNGYGFKNVGTPYGNFMLTPTVYITQYGTPKLVCTYQCNCG